MYNLFCCPPYQCQNGILGTNNMEEGFLSYITVGNALADMCTKNRNIDKACALFDRMPQRDVISWAAMIVGYTLDGFVAFC